MNIQSLGLAAIRSNYPGERTDHYSAYKESTTTQGLNAPLAIASTNVGPAINYDDTPDVTLRELTTSVGSGPIQASGVSTTYAWNPADVPDTTIRDTTTMQSYSSGGPVSVGGTANIATFTSTGITLKYATTTTANLGNVAIANYFTGTLTTAAQPNITSTGTLANLTVTGNATVGTLIVTVATAPTTSYGSPGDKKGQIAFDTNYMYYCRANYVDTSTDIWSRITMSQTAF
jgi:hypothetical protein